VSVSSRAAADSWTLPDWLSCSASPTLHRALAASYAFGTVATIAGIAEIAVFVAAVLMLALSVLGDGDGDYSDGSSTS
jgi:hypothetical protein